MTKRELVDRLKELKDDDVIILEDETSIAGYCCGINTIRIKQQDGAIVLVQKEYPVIRVEEG